MSDHIFVLQRSEEGGDATAVQKLPGLATFTARSLSVTPNWGGCRGLTYLSTGRPWSSDGVSFEEIDRTGAGDGCFVWAALDGLRFFCDRLGARTFWYLLTKDVLLISTSQKAIVALKGSFNLSNEAFAWFLSSGCQGPFVSWDLEIRQVVPDVEYRFNIESWQLVEAPRSAMETPSSGSGSVSEYLDQYESCVTSNIEQILQDYGDNEVLLPLSGGLDSRLILALARNAGLDGKLQLVNWGVRAEDGVFDDRVAASRVAAHYERNLIQAELPEVTEDLDHMLDRYVDASEGRVDHFNGYTDAFAMWDHFSQAGFRCILRGDIPFTEGLDTTEPMARAHLGLERLDDFPNLAGSPLADFVAFQKPFDIGREEGESLIRWRDRLYTRWRVPMVISAFSDIVSGYVDNRLPMMDWQLYRGYMALPDSAKGNKKHIEALWRRHDRSGVPSNAIGALRAPADSFADEAGYDYLQDELGRIAEAGQVYSHIASWLRGNLGLKPESTANATSRRWRAARGAVADALPLHVKGWLKARRPRALALDVIAYRLVLADKIQTMYAKAARIGRGEGPTQ